MKRVLLPAICVTLYAQVASADWNSSKEFSFTNDFSETIYKNGTGYNRTGPHPKAAQLVDGQLVVTLTEKMLDVDKKKTGRYELEKRNINSNLAVYQSFKVRFLDGYITDRVLISQIKLTGKNDPGLSPMASVLLDRSPNCITYSNDTSYGVGHHEVDQDKAHGIEQPSNLYVEKVKGRYQHFWSRTRGSNQPFRTLADGERHTVEMDVFPHPTDGYCIIKIDGEVWQQVLDGPTKSYFSGSHSDYAARIGIYRDAVYHSHKVAFDDWRVEAYDPKNGRRLQ